jgi:LPS-assembly protein
MDNAIRPPACPRRRWPWRSPLAALASALAPLPCAPPASMAPSSMVLLRCRPRIGRPRAARHASHAAGAGGRRGAARRRRSSSQPSPPRSRCRAATPRARLPIVLQAQHAQQPARPRRRGRGRCRVPPRRPRDPRRPAALRQPDRPGRARGGVRVARRRRLQRARAAAAVQRFEGFFLEPRVRVPRWAPAAGRARIDFLGSRRSRATNASYTSCPREGRRRRARLGAARASVQLDLDANEGIAEGAVLRFLGVPILALPR